jgi:hypothetical protein
MPGPEHTEGMINTSQQWVQLIQDFEAGTYAVVLSTGERVTVPSGNAYDPSLGLRRSTYDRSTQVLTLELVEGRRVEVEIGAGQEDALAGRLRVYLDQNKWVVLAQHLHTPDKLTSAENTAAATVIDWVRQRRIVLPLSEAHWSEIGSARARYRTTLVPLMLDLCRGWQMRSPLQVRTDELGVVFAEQVGVTGRSVREIVTLEPAAIFAEHSGYTLPASSLPPGEAAVDRHLIWATSLYSAMLDDEREERTEAEDLAARWATSFHELAQELRRNTQARSHSARITAMRMIIDMRDDVVRAALGARLAQSQFESWLVNDAYDDLSRLPYLGALCGATHARLRNAGDTWNSHDLTDMIYLACASAYADIVVCEKKAADYLTRAWRGRTGGAPLVTSLSALVERLRGQLGESTA